MHLSFDLTTSIITQNVAKIDREGAGFVNREEISCVSMSLRAHAGK